MGVIPPGYPAEAYNSAWWNNVTLPRPKGGSKQGIQSTPTHWRRPLYSTTNPTTGEVGNIYPQREGTRPLLLSIGKHTTPFPVAPPPAPPAPGCLPRHRTPPQPRAGHAWGWVTGSRPRPTTLGARAPLTEQHPRAGALYACKAAMIAEWCCCRADVLRYVLPCAPAGGIKMKDPSGMHVRW